MELKEQFKVLYADKFKINDETLEKLLELKTQQILELTKQKKLDAILTDIVVKRTAGELLGSQDNNLKSITRGDISMQFNTEDIERLKNYGSDLLLKYNRVIQWGI